MNRAIFDQFLPTLFLGFTLGLVGCAGPSDVEFTPTDDDPNQLAAKQNANNIPSPTPSPTPPAAPVIDENPQPMPPAAASNLLAMATSVSQINLAWTDNSSNETGFKIERSTSATGPFSVIATVAADISLYSNTGLNASTPYYYRVKSTNAVGDATASNQVSATTQTPVANQPPIVNAGPDQTITLPSMASLSATVTDDNLPVRSTLTYAWAKISGAGSVVFSSATSRQSTASFSAAGTYVLKMTASDSALSSSDEIQIIVNSALPSDSNLIPTSDIIDWSNAGILKPDGTAGIPTSTRCATLDAATANLDTINLAIKQCSNSSAAISTNKEVYLGPGTYNLVKTASHPDGTIKLNCSSSNLANCARNVTLRGAGPNQTILKFPDAGSGRGDIGIIGSGSITAGFNNVSGYINLGGASQPDVYNKGDTTLILATSGINAGDILQIDQTNDNIDVTVNTGSKCSSCSRNSGERSQQQWVKVVRIIDANHLEISPGLYMSNWKKERSPQAKVWKDFVEMVGIEDLKIENTKAMSNIMISHAYNCWVKNVRSENSERAHVWMMEGARLELRQNYFYETNVPTGDNRGIFRIAASDDLYIDNIFEGVPQTISLWAVYGSVIAYNFLTYMQNGVSSMSAGLAPEGGGSAMNLFEGNFSNGINFNNLHGSNWHNTAFKNRLVGYERNKIQVTIPVVNGIFNRYQNIIGNILGKDGFHTNLDATNTAQIHTSIYSFGFGYERVSTDLGYDPLSLSTVNRKMNYDYKTKGIQLGSGENLVTLPDSLVFSARPDWWDRPIWPPFDPRNPSASDYKNLPAGNRWALANPGAVPTELQ